MILTPQQISEVLSIVDKFTLTFIGHQIGPSILTPFELSTLQSAGINLSQYNPNTSNITQAYKFGILSTALNQATLRNMTYDQLKTHLANTNIFKMTSVEQAALENVRYQAYQDVQRLSQRMKSNISENIVRVDKATNTVTHSKAVTDAAQRAILERKGLQQVISEIGHSTKEWERDLGRIADYVMHTAFDEGRANRYASQSGTDDIWVYKDVYAGACKHCMRLYLTGGVGSQPILYKLVTLRKHATNVGRKVIDWKPVVGPTHPYCRCTLMNLPNDFTMEGLKNGNWIWDGNQFKKNMKKWERKVKRRSKVTVTVNDKRTEI